MLLRFFEEDFSYTEDDPAKDFDMSGLKLDIQDKLNTKVDVVAGPLKEKAI